MTSFYWSWSYKNTTVLKEEKTRYYWIFGLVGNRSLWGWLSGILLCTKKDFHSAERLKPLETAVLVSP